MTRFAAVITTLSLLMTVWTSTSFAGRGTCFERPRFDKPQFDKPQRDKISFDRMLMVQPVLEPQFFDDAARVKSPRFQLPRERPVIEKPVFDTGCSKVKNPVRSTASVQTVAKSTVRVQTPFARIASQPKVAVVVADCNCGPQKTVQTVTR